MKTFQTIPNAIDYCRQLLLNTGYEIKTEKWQGIELTNPMWETPFIGFKVVMPAEHYYLAEDCKPNLPWADIHFEERVSGLPLNPGESYKLWPFYGSDSKMRTEGDKFTHTYMERFWPKNAGSKEPAMTRLNGGIRFEYGDLLDVVRQLESEPLTRQAYLPIWFPEDTGAVHGGRVPCSIGYHFMMRNGFLHCTYQLRSCDFVRHLRDDIYLAIRLVHWILLELQTRNFNPIWQDVRPGYLVMNIASLHLFKAELKRLK